jgi:hypothetical protein
MLEDTSAVSPEAPVIVTKRLVILLGLPGLLAVACSTGKEPPPRSAGFGAAPSASASARTSASGTQGRPVLTRATAKKVHDEYERLLRQATAQGGTGLDKAESGLAAQLTQARLRVGKLRDGSATLPPVSSARFVIPRNVKGEPWFLVEYTRKGADIRYQLILQKTAAGWRGVAGSGTPFKAPALPIALDKQGLATAVTPGERTKLAASPNEVAAAHARSQLTGNKDARGRRLLAPGAYTTEFAAEQVGDQGKLAGKWNWRMVYKPLPPVYALRATGGGAVVWYAISRRDLFTARPGAPEMRFSQPDPATLSKRKWFAKQVTLSQASWYVAVVPAGTTSKARVVGDWSATIGVAGS